MFENTWINQTHTLHSDKVDGSVQEVRKLPMIDVWPSVLCLRDWCTDIAERWSVVFEAHFHISGLVQMLAKKLKRSTSLSMHQV